MDSADRILDHQSRQSEGLGQLTELGTFRPLTDDALAELRALIGKNVRRGRPHVEELNEDAIRHYAFGIGDANPLWTDPEYAAKTAHGGPRYSHQDCRQSPLRSIDGHA